MFALGGIVLSALLRQRLRTSLTILGIAVGIASVIGSAALGAGGAARVQEQIDALGEDFIWIRAGARNLAGVRTGSGGARTLVTADAAALQASIPEVAACSPIRNGRGQSIAGGRNWNSRYQGVWPDFFAIRRRSVATGSVFTAFDEQRAERVVVLGPAVASRLFPEEEATGRTIRIGQFQFRVIGVLAPRGTGRGGVDRDDVIFLPAATAERFLDGRPWITDIVCAVHDPATMAATESHIASLLRERHRLPPGVPDDFEIEQPLESLEMRARAAHTMAMTLTSIGAVSLVVGGVGIMNIMLVSVQERRREIGVRLAIGARVRDIRAQFLAEAATIGGVGGVLGLAAGTVVVEIMRATLGWAAEATHEVMWGAAVSAIGAGLLFGYYPAHRASRLDPIEAIRGEA
jgi:putative ABC transport system permease protein